MLQSRSGVLIAAVATLLAGWPAANSLASPFNFTPVHLVREADEIVVVKLVAADKPLTLRAEPLRTLKPKAAERKAPLILDLSTAFHQDHANAVLKWQRQHHDEPALLFVKHPPKDPQEQGDEGLPAALLHFTGRWVSFDRGKDGRLEMERIDDHMEGTWAGGTDMLMRAVEYILADPDADVPVVSGVHWASHGEAGKIDGKVNALAPVDLDDGMKQSLFLASDAGDRLYRYDERQKKLVDVTATHKLTSRSRLFAWADFNGDGRPDLASWNGKALSLHLGQADGTFKAQPLAAGADLGADLLGLSVVGTGERGRAGLLVSARGQPVLLAPAADGEWQARQLDKAPAATRPAGELKGAGACLVADFDGDGLADILQPFTNGGLLYRGRAAGQFDRPVACEVSLGDGRSGSFLGDFDGDGMVDVFATGEDMPRLWHNRGGGRFVESLGLSGEIAYISKPGTIGGETGDFNNDGRQDVLLVYGDTHPQLFFNRGFRSFWHAHEVDVAEQNLLGEGREGCQAGCLADLNGDGAQDMAVVLKTGQLWVFYREVPADQPALGVRVSLPGGGPAGPVTVVGYDENRRCLGAWAVTAGSPGFIGLPAPGKCRITWRWPGGKMQEKQIVVADSPSRFVIPADEGSRP